MANRFRDSFQGQGQQQPSPDMITQFNTFRANPMEYLNSRGIKVPEEYANNPEAMARYMMKSMPGFQQSRVFQMASMLGSLFGFKN